MKQRSKDATISALYDGEAEVGESLRNDPEVAEQLRRFRRLSALLRVPEEVGKSDPYFVTRFRARREALRDALGSSQRWRWLALRLVPLTACALLTTGLVVWASSDVPSAFGELEVRELGDGLSDITAHTATDEPALRIAFGEL